MNCLLHNTLRLFFAFQFCFHVFTINLSAHEKYDESINEDLYCFSRYAFLTTCKDHFSNNIGIEHAWMEAESSNVIHSFSSYFDLIPKNYESDCCHCYDCKGVIFNLYRGCKYPTSDVEALDELSQGHVQSKRGHGKRCMHDGDHCESPSWNGGYFRLWNHKYLHFFKNYLQYCSENEACQCYWPECDLEAMNINNRVSTLIKELTEEGLITHDFSSYWQARKVEFNHQGKIYTDLYYPNSHGIASSLTTYTFFYSQYHQMLLAIAEFIDLNTVEDRSEAIDKIYVTLDEIRNEFKDQYNTCIRAHPHPKIYYERGMLRMHSGNIEDALMDVNRLMRMAKTDRYKDKMILTSEMYQQEGNLYADVGIYDKAIISLSQAIKLDANNRGAYFDRAQAYFEVGDFAQSLDDYLVSKKSCEKIKTKLKPSWTVKEAILNGLQKGCAEAIVDFGPSLCHSVYGLYTSMWSFVQHPIDSTTQFVNACSDISKCINEFRKNIDLNEIESYPLEIQRLFNHFDRLSDSEKGHLVGYIVGLYGVDIFAGGATIKSINAFKKLKDANKLCILETMASTKANKEVIISSALKHKNERESFFKNVKLEWDKQNKHIVGKHNFELGRSEFVHSDPQALLSNFAGKGKPINNKTSGNPDYRERIDFGEFIGYYINEQNPEVKFPTTKGTIRYSKKGAHIIPSNPKEK